MRSFLVWNQKSQTNCMILISGESLHMCSLMKTRYEVSCSPSGQSEHSSSGGIKRQSASNRYLEHRQAEMPPNSEACDNKPLLSNRTKILSPPSQSGFFLDWIIAFVPYFSFLRVSFAYLSLRHLCFPAFCCSSNS